MQNSKQIIFHNKFLFVVGAMGILTSIIFWDYEFKLTTTRAQDPLFTLIVSVFALIYSFRTCTLTEYGVTVRWFYFIRRTIPWNNINQIVFTTKKSNRYISGQLLFTKKGCDYFYPEQSAYRFAFTYSSKTILLDLPKEKKEMTLQFLSENVPDFEEVFYSS